MNSQCARSMEVTVTDQRPSMAIVDLVARESGTDPIELEPLYDVIDPDMLDSLCESSSGFTSLEFNYHGRNVTVRADSQPEETVEISLAEPGTVAEGTSDVFNTESTI
ncbi:HalOD1 output domain-containing protein [Natrialba taiwanensis]|nr:HalOD1 output domain-containing protein [Natrialba taiwanensis]